MKISLKSEVAENCSRLKTPAVTILYISKLTNTIIVIIHNHLVMFTEMPDTIYCHALRYCITLARMDRIQCCYSGYKTMLYQP